MRQIPNLLTLANIFCGCVGLSASSIELQALLIFCGMLFDFSDGLAARLLNAQSEIGKQLDSLADMVTFGALPGLMLFRMMHENSAVHFSWGIYAVWLYTLGAAWRLARFNVEDASKDFFVGLPSPAAALVVASLPWALPEGLESLQIGLLLLCLSVGLTGLMVASLPLLSLKFKNLTWKDNYPRYFLIFISLLLVVIWQLKAIPLVLLGYVALSLIFKVQK